MSFFTLIFSFIVGGVLCVIAQLLIDFTSITPGKILVMYVCFGVFLGGVGLFLPLRDYVGTGITVPLVGFGGVIATGVREAVDKEGVLGILTGPLTAAAPGTTAALLCGFLASLVFKGKPKSLSRFFS